VRTGGFCDLAASNLVAFCYQRFCELVAPASWSPSDVVASAVSRASVL